MTLADTGEHYHDGGRVHRVERYLRADDGFLLTYGDGVGEHRHRGADRFSPRPARPSLTAVHPAGRFGELQLAGGVVTRFNEKPQAEAGLINGGFMALDRPSHLPERRPRPGPGAGADAPRCHRRGHRRLPARRASGSAWTPRRSTSCSTASGSRARALETLVMFAGAYRDRRVLVTGHTGFKGAWLAMAARAWAREVTGIALAPDTTPSLFTRPAGGARASTTSCDIRDGAALRGAVGECSPDFVFHLAAQPLVRLSYADPKTLETNVMRHGQPAGGGPARPAACARSSSVTTDKCYENREWPQGYRENDPLGGHDPYSASKGCAELADRHLPALVLRGRGRPAASASARAGNVIGGGDWAADRIVPDSSRALRAGRADPLRNKTATRPWQHVLEPLSGYLSLGARLLAEATARPSPRPGTSGRADDTVRRPSTSSSNAWSAIGEAV